MDPSLTWPGSPEGVSKDTGEIEPPDAGERQTVKVKDKGRKEGGRT